MRLPLLPICPLHDQMRATSDASHVGVASFRHCHTSGRTCIESLLSSPVYGKNHTACRLHYCGELNQRLGDNPTRRLCMISSYHPRQKSSQPMTRCAIQGPDTAE